MITIQTFPILQPGCIFVSQRAGTNRGLILILSIKTLSFGIVFGDKYLSRINIRIMIPIHIKKSIYLVFLALLVFACEKSTYIAPRQYTARIAGFDLNCSTCILEFPYDLNEIQREFGTSTMNYYKAVNLDKGNYLAGQKLKVNIRKAEINELSPCITLYPSGNYENIYISGHNDFEDLTLNDTLVIPYRECLNNTTDRFSICFDSLLSDSRCPEGAQCFWEGNAEAKFRFEKYNGNPVFFSLNTNFRFPVSAVIDGYKITLVGLTAPPGFNSRVPVKYKAYLVVTKD